MWWRIEARTLAGTTPGRSAFLDELKLFLADVDGRRKRITSAHFPPRTKDGELLTIDGRASALNRDWQPRKLELLKST
jgi:hypothetical protein